MEATASRGLRGWAPVIIGVTALLLALVAVVSLVSAQAPTAGRAPDVSLYSPPLVGHQDDLVSGELRREAGCTYLDGSDDRRWIVLFPDLGSRWDGDTLLVSTRRYFLDRDVDLRGKIVKLPVAGYDTDIAAGCRPTGNFFLVQI